MTLLRILAPLMVLLLPATASATFPGANGKIAFEADGARPNSRAVHLMNGDGSGLGPIRPAVATTPQAAPNFSRDGRFIVYADSRNLYITAADGSGTPFQLTKEAANDTDPAFSPDGKRVVFSRGGVGDGDLFVINVDGTGLVNISNDGTRIDDRPEWSPNGARIAYSGNPCFTGGSGAPQGGPCVFVMNADGSNKVNLTPEEKREECDPGNQLEGYSHAHHSTDPSWSPDGGKIAFTGYGDICKQNSGLASDIWVMNADGSGKVDLFSDQGTPDEQPTWSPDGSRIAFVSDRGGDGIFVTAASGGAVTRLTTGQDRNPNWGVVPPVSDGKIRGTEGDDLINGTTKADHILGLGGNDIINGLQSNDILEGGTGNDRLSGSEGSDRMAGGAGKDNLSGGTGNDRLDGGAGNDTLAGGQGTNTYSGGAGNDTINSVNGKRETVKCGSGRDSVRADRSDRLSGCERVRRSR